MITVELQEHGGNRVLEIHASGKIEKNDYDQFGPQVERLIARQGKIRVLLVLNDFHGWTAAALWEDIKFNFHHFNDIARMAIVGERIWEKGMAALCKAFTTAQIHFFPHEQLAEAHQWVGAAAEPNTPAIH